MTVLRLGSLFDGIGVFPLAAVRCGIEPVWASEIEKAPISITKRHFPDMAHLGDVTKLDGREIPPVHIITFGSPCQNLSQIGNRKGLAGEKSSLFFQAIRIIREMREATNGLFPAIAVWENVMGAFFSNDRMDFRAVLSAFTAADISMAATLNVYQEYGFTSPEQLEAAVDTAYQEMRQTSGELKALETKLQGKKELQQQVLAYAKTKPARDGLKAQKSEKARAAYRQANESDFIIAEAAARYFKAHGITKLPARKALQAEIEQLISEKDGLYNTYHEQKQRFKELQTVKRNIDQILRREEPRRRKEQSHER